MMSVISQIDMEVIDYVDGGSKTCRVFDLAVDFDILEADLAGYDPNSGTSRRVTVARKYARAILDAYAASKGG